MYFFPKLYIFLLVFLSIEQSLNYSLGEFLRVLIAIQILSAILLAIKAPIPSDDFSNSFFFFEVAFNLSVADCLALSRTFWMYS